MPLPRVQPIAPMWHKQPFDDPDWLFGMKYDDHRGLCYFEPRRNRLISRNNNILRRFEALAGQVAVTLAVDDAIIDGEIIAADETCRPVFMDLVRGTPAPAYVAFDVVWLDRADLQSLPLHEHRRLLRENLPKRSPIVSEALPVEGRGRELFELMCKNDLEGVVAKRVADPYEPSVQWLKIKNPDYTQKEARGDLSTTRAAGDARQHRRGAFAVDRVWCRIASAGSRSRAKNHLKRPNAFEAEVRPTTLGLTLLQCVRQTAFDVIRKLRRPRIALRLLSADLLVVPQIYLDMLHHRMFHVLVEATGDGSSLNQMGLLAKNISDTRM